MAEPRKDGLFKGQCLCGAVVFTATGDIVRVSACYCSQCRTQNGGGAFHGVELHGDLTVTRDNGLKWFDSSQKAERGFCNECGSSLFWRLKNDPNRFDISIGVLGDISRLTLDTHIFVDNRAPYQILPDDGIQMTEADVLGNAAVGA